MRFPARKVRQKRFVLDGEAVILGVDRAENYRDFALRAD
jgi:hypothetical protein